MNRKMKALAGLLVAAGCLWSAGEAGAVNPDSFTLTVTIGNQLSVDIENDAGTGITNYDFGSMTLGQTSVNTGVIDVDNTSGGLSQSYQLSIGDNGANNLLLRTTSGALAIDEYRVQALFQDAQPAHASFANEDILTATAQSAQAAGAGAVFATASTAAAQDGVSVADDGRLAVGGGSEVRLWLRLELAGTSTLSGVQTNFATVYVNAL